LGLLNSRQSNGSRLTKTNFVFGLRLLEYFSRATFPNRNGFIFNFFFLFRLCFSYFFNASKILYCTLTFALSCKILSKYSKPSSILKHRGENFVMMTARKTTGARNFSPNSVRILLKQLNSTFGFID